MSGRCEGCGGEGGPVVYRNELFVLCDECAVEHASLMDKSLASSMDEFRIAIARVRRILG